MVSFTTTLFSVLASLVAVAYGNPLSRDLCSKPPESELNTRLIALHRNSTHESFGMDPRVVKESRDVSAQDFATMSHTHLYGNTECPTTPPAAHAVLADRSTCPWYYVINHQPSRFPPTLAEAKCRCDGCLTKNKLDENVLEESATQECVPIPYAVRVLVQTGQCVDGMYEYVESWQDISVGCTCASPNFNMAGPAPTSAPSAGGPPMETK